eukprot:TRINITY_DN15195_c0_g2_i1.p1 TRINITY_DN15195_c0_g2~~TRINITY_DN15195_c0_g2_i1.p1  ORF type:complete len:296 (+),score=37.14 TRINITY_DN15195_c0_g2_i1:169-1056(+)
MLLQCRPLSAAALSTSSSGCDGSIRRNRVTCGVSAPQLRSGVLSLDKSCRLEGNRSTGGQQQLRPRYRLVAQSSSTPAGGLDVADSKPPVAARPSAGEIVPDTELSITKTSFGTIGLTVGVFLLSFGFGAYFGFLPGTDISAIMLTYGFPLTLIGFALKYAELKPVPCVSYADAVKLRDAQATAILLQVRSDVTRYRYGDEQHLEEALKRIFRYGQSGGIQRRNAPQLSSIAEEVYDGRYALRLNFDAPALTLADFTDRQAKLTSFFGPGVESFSEELEPKKYSVLLVATPAATA